MPGCSCSTGAPASRVAPHRAGAPLGAGTAIFPPPMVTDPLPRPGRMREQYEASDARPTLTLPDADSLQAITRALGDALAAEDRAAVKTSGVAMLALLAGFYG